ncbi:hypothetical protein NS365_13280 [Aureimonas ureilytica]|uniref:Uncharacterized protein n=1 Tax=Aureimonas ureilytica TaxID=401562 RepID=A0A175RMY2_9HYPH|nr:hypothetical protein [Aureimonas ureilytica]KTR04997.1 hypothetical protein NS365_13280 [Aureimonas ureilytica]
MSFIFDGNETPEQRAARQKRGMDALAAGAAQPAQNVGQGMSAVAQALAYRAMDANKTPADPWAGMRETGGMAPGGGLSARLMKLFGA